jgi:hypothetical protein
MTVTPYTPQNFLHLAKNQLAINDKISYLRRLSNSFPLDASAKMARRHLVALLAGSNRFEDALREYQKDHPEPGAGKAIDFKLIDYLLKTGRYNDVLRATAMAGGPVRDLLRDLRILELRVQALLAKGQYQVARECVEHWIGIYGEEGIPGSRFEGDFRSMQFLSQHLLKLERLDEPKGKAIFTASVPYSLQSWSRRRDVPVVFFKLIPAHPAGQMHQPLLPGRHDGPSFFEEKVEDINRGFDYLSGGTFSLKFGGLHTLYVKEGDIDPASSGGHLLTSRVYIHTIPQLYKLAGDAFVVLVDYRAQADDEAAYMGDGLIHLSARKLEHMILMHEILHGLGATHNEWNYLSSVGYKFDPEDRGLMTFDRNGELRDLGLEEKNRALLGWPHVAVVRLGSGSDVAAAPALPPSGLN